MSTTQFEQYYRDNLPALRNFARRLTNGNTEAEDLVQETAMKAYRGMHTFKSGTSFKSWAFTILKNSFITRYNRKKKRQVVNAPIEDFTFALQNNYAVRNDAVSQLRIQEIKECTEQLSEKSQLPFKLHMNGYQYKEIAEQLSIPIGTVKSRINFARKKLKEMLVNRGVVAA